MPMLYRDVLREMSAWLKRDEPKILVLRGARQVGKTTAVRSLPEVTGGHVRMLEVNLEEHPEMERSLATLNADSILEELSFIGGHVPAPGDIVFLDEVQAAPSAMQALRYLRERRPDLRFIAAGSLLDMEIGRRRLPMPVGRVEYLFIGPLTFREYLAAGGRAEMELELMERWVPGMTFPEAAHTRLLEVLRHYIVIGGMPEAVARFLDTGDPAEVSRVHASILNTYREDFARYDLGNDLLLTRRVFDWVPARAGEKVVYARIDPDHRAGAVRRCIDRLCEARVVLPVTHASGNGLPLGGEARTSAYKMYFLDVGLMAHMTGITRLSGEHVRSSEFVNRGKLAEQFVAQHLLFRGPPWERPILHYWLRNGRKGNAEVDFLIEGGGRVVPVEVKSGSTGSMKSLLRFAQEKEVPLAVRFDANPPSFKNVQLRLADGHGGSSEVRFNLLSLPLYMVGEAGRLLEVPG